MRLTTVLVLLVLLLLAAFAALNWNVFLAPAPLDLLVTRVEAPPALVMLAFLAAIVVAGLAALAVAQARMLAESRRHAKELQAQRQLADQAEASRFTELRAAMIEEMARLSQRLGTAQEAMRGEIRDQANSLAAMIGEIDDRAGLRGTRPPR